MNTTITLVETDNDEVCYWAIISVGLFDGWGYVRVSQPDKRWLIVALTEDLRPAIECAPDIPTHLKLHALTLIDFSNHASQAQSH